MHCLKFFWAQVRRGNFLVGELKRTARFVSSNLERPRATVPEKFTGIRVRSDGELGHANMQAPMKVGLQLPSFTGATDWLNLERPNATNHDRLEALKRESKGRPILVHFWSLTSDTAQTNLTQIADWRDQRKREGLRVIAVHSPQSATEKKQRAVRDAVERFNLIEPCALDNEHKIRAEVGDEATVFAGVFSVRHRRHAALFIRRRGRVWSASKTNWMNC